MSQIELLENIEHETEDSTVYTIGCMLTGLYPYWCFQYTDNELYFQHTPAQEFQCSSPESAQRLLDEYTELFGNVEGCRVVSVTIRDDYTDHTFYVVGEMRGVPLCRTKKQ